MLRFALYVSNHGFGHASRISALAEQLISYGVYCHIISEKPAFLYSNLDNLYFTQHFRSVDSGVKHGQNLVVDMQATRNGIISIMGNRNRILAEELEFIRKEEINLIISDAPYIVSIIAQYADIPVFTITNFDWYYIYCDLFKNDAMFKPVLNTIWSMYRNTDRSFRLPFSTKESVSALPNIDDCGLLARSKKSYTNLRKKHGWRADTQILLVMFGGEGGMELDYEALCEAYDGIVISNCEGVNASNHFKVSFSDDYMELIFNADVILCKPGYSTFAEAVQFGKYIIYCPRGAYPEEIALVDGLKGYPNCIELDSLNNDIISWKQILSRVSSRKVIAPKFRNKNTHIAALMLKRYLETKHPHAKLLSIFDLGSNSLNYALFDLKDGKVIHSAHCTTHLGRGFSKNKLSTTNICFAKSAMSPILNIDKSISSEKVLLATGVSRIASNSTKMLTWAKDKYSINAKVISEKEETRYVYHAAKDLAGGEEGTLAIDVGGASTEFVIYGKYGKYNCTSVPVGLLTIHNSQADAWTETKGIWDTYINDLTDVKPTIIIGVGLTFTYLASVLFKTDSNNINEHHGKAIKKATLLKLKTEIMNQEQNQYLPYLLDEGYLPILSLSIAFSISLLDKFAMSEILVCADGISIGYAKWRLTNPSRKLI
ncbi:MAG: hypothetical protein CVU50_08410 [Candidatus Cloacimonetes bacterium HGW-Cloacimonetes-3]|jgi:hypothetical protein|nr:MAG: hypothetical protein CVU50_08410 [Candidatus Cloacimonetes bacterium HGW-Cloacimonetes-3]